MKLFLTGATGFLGTHTIAAALERNHDIVALARRPQSGGVWEDDRVRVVLGDLRAPAEFGAELGDADAIIHLAASKAGDFYNQLAGTVVATEALLAHMPDAGTRLVHVSTFSVYDYDDISTGATLDETSATETDGADRDAYTQTKLIQERLVREWAEGSGADIVIIRPGAVWGANELWAGGRSMHLGPLGVTIGPRSALKLTYIENCAEALVLAAESDAAIGATINVVDDEQPTATEFATALRAAGADLPPAIPVPYVAAIGLANLADFVKHQVLGGRARTPAILDPARLAAMRRHHVYGNDAAKALLGWTPRYSLADAAARAIAREHAAP